MQTANKHMRLGRILVRAALETGARYQELARLRVADFNPDSGTLHIRKSKANRNRHVVLTDDGREFFAGLVVGRKGADPMLRREWKQSQQDPLSRLLANGHISTRRFRFGRAGR
jgi:integrase